MLDVFKFGDYSDETIIDEFLEYEKKVCTMIEISDDEREYYYQLFDEIKERDISGKVDGRRNKSNM